MRVFASAVCNARPPQHRRGQNCGLYQLAVLPARRVHRSTFCSCNTRPDTDRRAAGPCRPGLCAPCETSSARLVSFAWVTRKGRGWCHDRSPGSERRGENLKIFFDRARKFRIYSSSRRNIDFDTVFLVAILSRSSGRFFKYHHRHHPRGLSTVDNRRSALFNIHVEDLCLPSCPVCTTSKHGSLNTQPYTLLEIIVCQYA